MEGRGRWKRTCGGFGKKRKHYFFFFSQVGPCCRILDLVLVLRVPRAFESLCPAARVWFLCFLLKCTVSPSGAVVEQPGRFVFCDDSTIDNTRGKSTSPLN